MSTVYPISENFNAYVVRTRHGGVYKSNFFGGLSSDNIPDKIKKFVYNSKSKGRFPDVSPIKKNTETYKRIFIKYADGKISSFKAWLKNMGKSVPYILNEKGKVKKLINVIDEKDILEKEVYEILGVEENPEILVSFFSEFKRLNEEIKLMSEGMSKEELKNLLHYFSPCEVDESTLNDIKKPSYLGEFDIETVRSIAIGTGKSFHPTKSDNSKN